jgi:8-oxo-dGTP pyrophosphatase MutT (NUDIX family)
MNQAKVAAVDARAEGPVDPSVDAVLLVEANRRYLLTLMEPGWWPPLELVTQAYGLCFTVTGTVLLIRQPDGSWSLPGGTVEAGELPEQTLVREVAEEACARVLSTRYLASQHVADVDHPEGPRTYYQTRWWARVDLDPWDPRFETTGRRTVPADRLAAEISWRDTSILNRLLELASTSS